MNGEVIKDMIRITGVERKPPFQAFFEEDILVPDTRPDVVRIGAFNIIPKLTEKENYGGNLRLGGDMYLEVLYAPSSGDGAAVEVVNSRLPFRHEVEADGIMGDLEIIPKVEHLEVSIVNERKLRMKTVISFSVREYKDIEKNTFMGFRNEDIELLKESISITDISDHKKDYVEVKEDVSIKDGMPEIGSILKHNFRVWETYRQVSSDKAIISGSIYFDIMYLSDEAEPEPVWMPGTIDFTQFIKLDGGIDITGSDVMMKVDDVRVSPKRDVEDNMTLMEITVGISSRIDTYTDKSLDLVMDAYHNKKVLDIEKDKIDVMRFGGSGSGEATVRERISLNGGDDAERIVFASGEILPIGGEIENGRFIADGVLIPEVIYINGEDSGVRSVTGEIPFRGIVDVPGLKRGMNVSVDFVVRGIRAEKVGGNFAEVSGEIGIVVKGYENLEVEYVKNSGIFEDMDVPEDNVTRLILYTTRNNDRLWDIGKRFRVSQEELKRVNGIDEGAGASTTLDGGNRLLIWA